MGHRHGAKAPSGAYAEAATGGLAASQYLSDVCVWDQASGGWRPSVHMQTGRSRFAATVLQGRVYAVGGICAEGPTASVESWAPGESSWRLEPDLPGARYGHRLCQLQGRLYVVGGVRKAHTHTATPRLSPRGTEEAGSDSEEGEAGQDKGVVGNSITSCVPWHAAGGPIGIGASFGGKGPAGQVGRIGQGRGLQAQGLSLRSAVAGKGPGWAGAGGEQEMKEAEGGGVGVGMEGGASGRRVKLQSWMGWWR